MRGWAKGGSEASIDLIPDFIPILGYLDALVLVPLGIALVLRMIPTEVMGECRLQAQDALAEDRPTNWVAAGVIVAIWVLLAALAITLLARAPPRALTAAMAGRVNDAPTIAKLGPLLLLILLGAVFEIAALPSAEVVDAPRTLPVAMAAGMAVATAFYLLANATVTVVVPWPSLARSAAPWPRMGTSRGSLPVYITGMARPTGGSSSRVSSPWQPRSQAA
jgi:amino acid transporter